MGNDIRVHRQATGAFHGLPPGQRKKLLWWADRLRQDPTAGEQIQMRKIPAAFSAILERKNLWILHLPDGWRALYTIQSDEDEAVLILILFIGSHKQYDRLMGYRR